MPPTTMRTADKLARVTEVWHHVVPGHLLPHCTLVSLERGRLVVKVDTAAAMFDVSEAMADGLEQQILAACRGTGLKRIVLT